jgi:integrase
MDFRRDADAYLAMRKNPDVFDESRPVPRRSLAETTLRQHQEHLRLAASVLIKEKRVPAATIASLADLIAPEAFKAILRYYREKANAQPNAFVVSLSKTLIQVAHYHSNADVEHIKRLKALAGKLAEVPWDLTEKNDKLLRKLEPKEARAKLLFLPERLSNEVASDWKAGRFRVIDAQCAIAIDVQLAVPLRPQNLSALHWQRHFRELDSSGRLLLRIPAAETKTRKKDLVAEIPEDVARRIRWYRRVVLPRLGSDPNGYLFVTRGGARKHQKTLTIQIIACIARYARIHMTPHQFRHFAAVSYLEENPEDFETPRALLGHAFSKTTRVYAGSSTRRAGRAYGNFLFASRDKLRLQQPIKPRRRTPRKKGA